MPLFSIILPIYKSSDTLQKALSSCVNQSFKDIEVIIIDDNDNRGGGGV